MFDLLFFNFVAYGQLVADDTNAVIISGAIRAEEYLLDECPLFVALNHDVDLKKERHPAWSVSLKNITIPHSGLRAGNLCSLSQHSQRCQVARLTYATSSFLHLTY